jgi:hypothetical protein
MIKLRTASNEDLITYLTDINGKLPSNEYLICITGTDEDPIVAPKHNILPVTFDNELYGPRLLSFTDAFRIFKFIRNKVITDAKKLTNIILIITCKDGLVLSGAVAQWASEFIDASLLDASYFQENNLFIEPSQITINKLYLVQMLFQEIVMSRDSLPSVAARILELPGASALVKKNSEDYLNALFINETKLLEKVK